MREIPKVRVHVMSEEKNSENPIAKREPNADAVLVQDNDPRHKAVVAVDTDPRHKAVLVQDNDPRRKAVVAVDSDPRHKAVIKHESGDVLPPEVHREGEHTPFEDLESRLHDAGQAIEESEAETDD